MTSDTPIHLGDLQNVYDFDIPRHALPARIALAVNCMVSVQKTDSVSLLLHNFDPVNWNQWYPIFSSHQGPISFPGGSARDLVNYLTTSSPVAPKLTPSFLRQSAIDRATELLDLRRCTLCSETLQNGDIWLKYSKSQHVWTLYCYVFYCASTVDPISHVTNPTAPDLALIPLGQEEFAGLRVVENVINLLRADRVRALLIENAIRS
jgi:hypothetical protein